MNEKDILEQFVKEGMIKSFTLEDESTVNRPFIDKQILTITFNNDKKLQISSCSSDDSCLDIWQI